QKMLDTQDLDIVSVCAPNTYHKPWTIAALQAGAHVLCEKPVATSYQDAVEMYAAAEKAGRQLLVGQSLRFHSANQAAKSLVEAGLLGDTYYAEAGAMRRRGVPEWGLFHIKEHSGGGPIYDIGVHALDLVLWLVGSPRVVAVSGATYTRIANQDEGLLKSLADSGAPDGVPEARHYDYREFDVEDLGVGLLRLENGMTIVIRASWAANIPEGTGNTFILGTKAGLALNPVRLLGTLGKYQADITPQIPGRDEHFATGHIREAAHLVRVIRGEEELSVKKCEVLNVIHALEGLYQSAARGQEVQLAW
ncbi:MAG: Gfo/Idh/MocA family oxidoreductase, partial [Chloroflexi bacterium]|nr:Gfo/Idh/MocA family oxidoreductase [Chloroflexota bacterium]